MANTIYSRYRDNVFCLLHQEKANLLELYNAMNGTRYSSAESLRVVTLPNAICMKYHNDAAYTFNSDLSLYEQQSTDNPNMPLRVLYYIAEEYQRIVPSKGLYYGSRIKIPTPHFVVFYNGTKPQPERKVYRLSELFEKPEEPPELELAVTVLNINDGYNTQLLSKCSTLRGYMAFVNKVRDNRAAGGMDIEEAVRDAVDRCIAEGILADFFRQRKEEVVGMGIFEFDEELYKEAIQEDAREEGHREGRREAILELVKDGLLSIADASQKLGKTETQIREMLRDF